MEIVIFPKKDEGFLARLDGGQCGQCG